MVGAEDAAEEEGRGLKAVWRDHLIRYWLMARW